MQARLDRVTSMLITMTPMDLIQQQLALEWGVSRQTISGYVSKVYARMQAAAAPMAPYRRTQMAAAWQRLYQVSLAAGKHETCNNILANLAKLEGLVAPTKVDVQGTLHHGGQIGVGLSLGPLGFTSPEDVRARIAEIQAKLKADGPNALAATSHDDTMALLDPAGNLIAQVVNHDGSPEPAPTTASTPSTLGYMDPDA